MDYKAIDIVCNYWTPDVMRSRLDVNNRLRQWQKIMRMGDEAFDRGTTEDEMLRRMDAVGIEKAFLVAANLGVWDLPYETVASAVQRHPDRFVGVAGINPEERMHGVRKLQHAVQEYGFIAAHLYPHWFGKSPNDKAYYPFYTKCAELAIPIQIQVGHSAQTHLRTVGFPVTLDEVAIDFPELSIIGIHTGWPWVEEMIAVSWKHPNVYIGTDAHAPKYWDPKLVQFLNTRGQDKVIFGTDFPVIDFERALGDLSTMSLKPEARRKLLRDNAVRVFGLK